MLVFESADHFEFLRERLGGNAAPRGIKTRFAKALLVQPAYLSQVLARKYSLSLEQADFANQFFDHDSDEADFFLALVSRDRAGTPSLRRHFELQLKTLVKKRLQVTERIGRKAQVSEEAKGIYYSSWLYSAVRVSCTIPQLRTRQAIADKLNMPPEVIGKVLDFLVANQILEKKETRYEPRESWTSLDKESPHIIKHHTNWRNQAIQHLEAQTDQDLHYSGIFSLDLATALRAKDRFLDFLSKQVKDFETAPEEDLFSVGVDLFRVGKKTR